MGIDTKSTLVLRDLDLLARIASHNPVIIKLTITCADDAPVSYTHLDVYKRQWMNSWEQACVVHHITTREAAQSCPGPVSGYALFYGNTYLTNEIQSEKKAEKLWKTYGSKTVQAG